MQFLTIEEAQEKIDSIRKGDRIAFMDKEEKIRIGTVRFKKGKAFRVGLEGGWQTLYVYAQLRIGRKVTEKYIGRKYI